jgi:hypothetical protein
MPLKSKSPNVRGTRGKGKRLIANNPGDVTKRGRIATAVGNNSRDNRRSRKRNQGPVFASDAQMNKKAKGVRVTNADAHPNIHADAQTGRQKSERMNMVAQWAAQHAMA